MGDRATEVAVVMLENGLVVDRYQSLMNAGVRVNSFIT
jgi:DNA polymerase-3 subunit epsilon